MQVNGDEYTYFGHKNWTLLRKHVYAVEQYCKREFNGKIPAKKDMKTVLAKALNSRDSLPLKPSVVPSNQRHAENPAKPVLEKYSVEFPSPSFQPEQLEQRIPAVNTSSLYYRCKPSSKEEEEAQFQTALMESRALSRNEDQPRPELGSSFCSSDDLTKQAACNSYNSESKLSGNASLTKNNYMTLEEFLASDDSQNDSDSTTDDTTEAASILLSLLQE